MVAWPLMVIADSIVPPLHITKSNTTKALCASSPLMRPRLLCLANFQASQGVEDTDSRTLKVGYIPGRDSQTVHQGCGCDDVPNPRSARDAQDFDRLQKTATSDQELFDQTEQYPRWVANQSWLMFGLPQP
jgi:hypothetical protein